MGKRKDVSSTFRNPDGLTDREVEVLTLLVQGHTNKEIAAKLVPRDRTAGKGLCISIKTVEKHRHLLYQKLKAYLKQQVTPTLLAKYAAKHGYGEEPGITLRISGQNCRVIGFEKDDSGFLMIITVSGKNLEMKT